MVAEPLRMIPDSVTDVRTMLAETMANLMSASIVGKLIRWIPKLLHVGQRYFEAQPPR